MSIDKLLQKSKELRDKATPAQWKLDNRVNAERKQIVAKQTSGDVAICCFCSHWDEKNFVIEKIKNDADFIVHACNTSQAKDEIIKMLVKGLEKIISQDGGEMLYPQGPRIAKETIVRANELAAGSLE